MSATACATASTSATTAAPLTMSLPDFLLPPPLYSVSAAAPQYSTEPGPSEQRLAITSRKPGRPSLGTLRRSHSGIVIALLNQDETADAPTYGRGGYIAGDVELASNQNILSVTATIEGRLELTVAELTESEAPFLSVSQTLWKADGTSTCPSVLPFELLLPETFQDRVDERTRPLPPSYDPHSDGINMKSLSARVEYRIVIRVTKAKLGKMLWKPSKSLTVRMNYAPRSRPHQPILASPFPFLAGTLKSLPEEWMQICAIMSATERAPHLTDIDCHLFIPAVQIYGKTDSIPFSLQLRAPAASLQALLRPAAPSMSALALRRMHTASSADRAEPTLRVFIRRQVVVNARGQRVARSYIIGEGVLREVPPGAAPVNVAAEEGCEAVDYEGEVRCAPEVTVGGFSTARLTVSDFLMFSIVPAGASVDSFAELSKAHPIRIVTESYRAAT
ncbi:unnamed protein product [Peniophora sp. CBMAI 1063]|nr:unnamed protein product [Peniophora sp. CBMAI 1063]